MVRYTLFKSKQDNIYNPADEDGLKEISRQFGITK